MLSAARVTGPGRAPARSGRARARRRGDGDELGLVLLVVAPEAFERRRASAAWRCSWRHGVRAGLRSRNRVAVDRLYRLKRRWLGKPAAVMFFDVELAMAVPEELGPRTRVAFEGCSQADSRCCCRIAAGRFPLACGEDPLGRSGCACPGYRSCRTSAGRAPIEREPGGWRGPDASRRGPRADPRARPTW